MLRWISENYRTFLWAFSLAVAVWISAVTSADPDVTRVLPDPIALQIIGQAPNLVMNSDVIDRVELTMRAPQSVWDQIDADPKLVKAILDISGLSSGEHTLDVQVQVDARPVQIVSVAPKSVTFILEPLATKNMNVTLELSGDAAIGFQAGESSMKPGEVVISGAESEVKKVSRVQVSLNLDGVRENIDESLAIELLDENGEKISGINVSPDHVQVLIPVIQQGGYRDVAVKVNIVGRVASGYRLTDLSVFPPVVTVFSSNPELVSNLPGIVETEPLDLQNAQDNINTRLSVNLPQGVTIIGDQTVLVQAGVSPIESSVTLAGEKIEIMGLREGLTAQVSPTTVDIIISGPLSLLDTLTRQDVRITVDLTDLAAGTYQLTPNVEILIANVDVESILPNTIEVVVGPINGPSITPTATP